MRRWVCSEFVLISFKKSRFLFALSGSEQGSVISFHGSIADQRYRQCWSPGRVLEAKLNCEKITNAMMHANLYIRKSSLMFSECVFVELILWKELLFGYRAEELVCQMYAELNWVFLEFKQLINLYYLLNWSFTVMFQWVETVCCSDCMFCSQFFMLFWIIHYKL